VISAAAENVTNTTADIHRVALEPATMKIEYGTAPGVYTDTINNTVLNADKTVQLTGLSGGTTYYVKVTSYDGQANGTESAEISFTTCDVAPTLGLGTAAPYWASYADYTARLLSVDYPVNNTGSTTAYNVNLTNSSPSNGVTLASILPIPVGNISASSSATVTVQYNVPSGVVSFKTTNGATAEDNCATTYTYGTQPPSP
jgi:hypothetical protein